MRLLAPSAWAPPPRCALAWVGGSAAPASAATVHRPRLGDLHRLHGDAAADGARCWPSERVVRAGWHICHYDGATPTLGAPTPSSGSTTTRTRRIRFALESARIAGCGAGRSYGYDYLARRAARGRKLKPGGVVDRCYAELYSSEFTVDELFGPWSPNRGLGVRLHRRGTNARTRTAVARGCNAVARRAYSWI